MNFQTISKLKNSNLHVNMYAHTCKCTDRTFRQTKNLEPNAFKQPPEIRQISGVW